MLVALSTQVAFGSSQETILNGFVITGSGEKTVIVRGLGPSLATSGFSGVIKDPMLEVYDSKGALIASNDNWADVAESPFAAGGIYEELHPTSDLEAAVAITLPAGTYWTIVRSKNDPNGLSVAEVIDHSKDSDSKIVNVTGQGPVQGDRNPLIGGLRIEGGSDASLVIRALGPSLSAVGTENALSDPLLELYDSNGSLINSNDNWKDKSDQASQITAKGLAPTSQTEAAVVVSLAPGKYTALIRGKNNGTGVASLEAYKLP